MEQLQALRDHVVRLLRGGHAFDTFEVITSDVPPEKRGDIPVGAEHSAWQILEHIRISQRDILDFSRNEDGSYVEKRWPDEYWPAVAGPPNDEAWDQSIEEYLADREAIEALVADDGRVLFTPFPWGDGQTLLREALLVADHAAYHLGQLVILTRLLDA